MNRSLLTDLEYVVVERGDGVDKETERQARGVDGRPPSCCTTIARTDPLVIWSRRFYLDLDLPGLHITYSLSLSGDICLWNISSSVEVWGSEELYIASHKVCLWTDSSHDSPRPGSSADTLHHRAHSRYIRIQTSEQSWPPWPHLRRVPLLSLNCWLRVSGQRPSQGISALWVLPRHR